jgi:hypothetical protein
MNSIISKTLGGLSNAYYFRQFLFGLIFPALFYSMLTQSTNGIPGVLITIVIVNTLLYPYSRFVYEKITGFIFGENVFFVNAIFLLVTKFITMYFCWALAIFIAPVGLGYLYFHHSKNQN